MDMLVDVAFPDAADALLSQVIVDALAKNDLSGKGRSTGPHGLRGIHRPIPRKSDRPACPAATIQRS